MAQITRTQAQMHISDVLTEFINKAQYVKDSGVPVNANGKKILDGLETAKKALVKLEDTYFAQLSDEGIQTFLDKCKILAHQFELEKSKKIQSLVVRKGIAFGEKNNKLSEARQEELLSSLSKITTSTAIINVAPNPKREDIPYMNYRNDPVEYGLLHENSIDGNVINVENNAEYKFILFNIPPKVKDLIITGGHGNSTGTKLGKILTSKNINVNITINIYFPDCNIGKNIDNLKKSYGDNAVIFAKSGKTNEADVKKFLDLIHRNPNVQSSDLQRFFIHNIEEK